VYKKHYPPTLQDEVWRLDRIGKDGAFHKRLSKEGIETVEQFLRLLVMHPLKLRNVCEIMLWTVEISSFQWVLHGVSRSWVSSFLCYMLVNSHWSDITQEGPAYTKASFVTQIYSCLIQLQALWCSRSVTSLCVCVCMAGTWEWDVKQNVGRHC
jgi:hypothetical protein